LPIRNSLPSTSTLSDLNPLAKTYRPPPTRVEMYDEIPPRVWRVGLRSGATGVVHLETFLSRLAPASVSLLS
jgi:hypothetical protein